jgi:hypothetical protein
VSDGNNRIEFRVDDRQLAEIKERAIAAGTTLSEFVRARALGKKPTARPRARRRPSPKPRTTSIEKAKQEEVGSPSPVATTSARESFVADRVAELVAAGHAEVVARAEAEAEWRYRVRRGDV